MTIVHLTGGNSPLGHGQVGVDQREIISVSKHRAIRLAIIELERIVNLFPTDWEARQCESEKIIRNLLTGLGCEAVVEAWNECT